MTTALALPSVSVVVPVYNAGPYLRRCLVALLATSPPPLEIILVADGDSDGSFRLVEDPVFRGIRLVRLPRRVGAGEARNAGGREARGEVLFFVDADVEVRRDTIALVASVFRARPQLTALFGSYDDAPADPGFLSQYRNLLHHHVHQTGNEQASTFWSACGAIRREAFLGQGGYIKGHMEDVELGYRLTHSGHQVLLYKALQVKHLKRWTPWMMIRTDVFQRALPWTLLILDSKRSGHLINDLNLRTSSRISVALVFALLGDLLAACVFSAALWGAVPLALGLLLLNRDCYRFYLRTRGLRFTLAVIPWHWIYYLCGGLGFLLGHVIHVKGLLAPFIRNANPVR